MFRRSSTIVPALVIASFTLLTACAARGQRLPDVRAHQSTVDTIAARLADLELTRIALSAGSEARAVSSRDINTQIASLHERLHELPDHTSAERVVAERLLLAFDARESSLASQLRQLRLVYTDEHPVVRRAVEEERLLTQRRSELRAGGGDARDARGAVR